MGSTFVNTKTRFSITIYLHENKIFDQAWRCIYGTIKKFYSPF